MSARTLLLGGQDSCGAAIERALADAGHDVQRHPWGAELPADLAVDHAVLAPAAPAGTTAAQTDVAAMLEALDAALVSAGLVARDLLARATARADRRIVVLCDWAVTGPPAATIEAAVMGGMLGLARSFALEFAPLGVTANAVIVGPDVAAADRPLASGLVRNPTPEAVAAAVMFFLSPPAGCVTGQVLTVCGGRTAARVPV